MIEKFFILTASLIFILWLSGGYSNTEITDKNEWNMSNTFEIEETYDVNNDLHGENSVENVENSNIKPDSASK